MTRSALKALSGRPTLCRLSGDPTPDRDRQQGGVVVVSAVARMTHSAGTRGLSAFGRSGRSCGQSGGEPEISPIVAIRT
jgi:hypothetical protein